VGTGYILIRTNKAGIVFPAFISKNMKKFLVLCFVGLMKISSAQCEFPIKDASDELENILNDTLQYNPPGLFISDFETIETIIKRTRSKYKIVYNFSISCNSSRELFPAITEFVNNNNDFELLLIYGYREIDTAWVRKYLMENKFHGNLFILDTKKYGNRRNPSSRNDKLIRKICKDCDYKRMGLSSFYVFDERDKVVLHNNWTVVGMDKIKQLEEWYRKQMGQ
jgi:hypothetical protein